MNKLIFFAGCILSLVLMAPLASTSFIKANEKALEEGKREIHNLTESLSTSDPSGLYNQSMFNQEHANKEIKLDNCEENDTVCLLHQRLRVKRIKQFKIDLLKQLKMKEPPIVSKSELPSQLTIASLKKRHGIDHFEKRSEINSQKMKIEKKEVISLAKLKMDGESEEGCYFELTDAEKKFKARKATLWLYIQPNATRIVPSAAHITFIQFEKAENGSYIPVTGPTLLILITSDKGHWKKIEITDHVNRVLTNQSISQMMKVVPENDAQDLVMVASEDQFAFKPYIHLTLVEDTTVLRRGKRSSDSRPRPECYGQNAHLHCCMFDLEINFKQVGWDFVVFPKSFNAKYCSGSCDYAHTRDTMRSRLVAHEADYFTQEEAASCCAPKTMDPISIIYHDDESNVVISEIDEMVISGCRCV